MKVLHVINALDSGGAQKLLLDLAKLAQSEGERLHLLILKDSKSEIFYDEIVKTNAVVIDGCFSSLYNLKIVDFLVKKIRHYDIIHTHLFPTQYYVSIAKKIGRLKCRLITTEHNTFNRRRNYKIFQYIDKWIYSSYDKIVSISDKTQESLLEWINAKSETVFSIIHNGIHMETYRDAVAYEKAQWNYCNEDILLLMVARFDDQKDHNTLLKALRQLSKNYKLLLVGQGTKEAEYKEYCVQNNLESRVVFLGARNDVPSIIKSVDICVLSSNWEGFGLVAVEYMAAGKPTIVSDVPGLRQVVDNSGLVFKRGSSDELIDHVIRLNDPSFYRMISAAATKRAQVFDISTMKTKYELLYETISKNA